MKSWLNMLVIDFVVTRQHVNEMTLNKKLNQKFKISQ